MEQVIEFFGKLFDTAGWPPRWNCGKWTDFHGWFYIISDLLIWSAYFAIPLTILKYLSRRVDARFLRTYLLFAAFILACGSTHLLDAITFWVPAYRLNALIRFITGVVSWVTVFHLIRILPMATSLRSHAELEKEISERKKAEENLQVSNQQLNAAQEIAKIGHWEWDVAANRVSWSNELYKIYRTPPGSDISYESYLEKLHPEDRDFVNKAVQQAFAEKSFPSFTHRILFDDGSERILQSKGEVLTNEAGEVVKMIGTAQDITELQKAQVQLQERTQALETSNAELQRFAYVASHDLQEPLRKIMTFASLLEKEVAGNATEKGKVYMDKIVESSDRMQQLIDDILAFSSLRATREAFRPTDLNLVLKQVLSDMEVRIDTTGATVHADKLPVIEAIPSQMGQLFQNLISNGLKFRKEGVRPSININCRLVGAGEVRSHEEVLGIINDFSNHSNREQFVRIEITDNGIGFDDVYAGKIFEIFQRLHSNKMYEGTGIGLAICKRIIDNHHGHIAATGKPGEGATFILFLPLSQKNFLMNETTGPQMENAS
jgi:signal transduction histidine kinase